MKVDSDDSVSASGLSNFNIKLFKIRWVLVLILAFLNALSAYIWISFSPVADHTLKFYNTDEDIVNWLSAVFIITTIVFGLPAIFIVDYFGVRVVIIFSSFFLFICGIFRVITSSFLPFHSNNIKIALLFVGQISASFSQPLLMFLPTKLAFVWFPDRQRTIANTIGSLGNPLGVLLGSGLVPIIVQSFEDIPLLNWITFSITCVGPFLALITIFHDRPKIPPSIAAYIVEEKRSAYSHSGFSFTRTIRIYGEYILQALRVPGFIILWISFSTALAYFTVFSALAQQILCAKGYSDKFAGLVGSLMIICGLIGAAISAIIMDRTGKLKEMIKICYCLAILGEAGLSTLLFIPKMAAGILVFSCWLGTFGFAQYSVILEAAAEATYPVPESITTGLLIVGSQILSLVFLPMLQAVSPYLDESSFEAFSPTCGQASHPKDYAPAFLGLLTYTAIVSIVQLFFLRFKYKRRDLEIAASPLSNMIESSSNSIISPTTSDHLSRSPPLNDFPNLATVQIFSVSPQNESLSSSTTGLI